jgi:hypothetical protein
VADERDARMKARATMVVGRVREPVRGWPPLEDKLEHRKRSW